MLTFILKGKIVRAAAGVATASLLIGTTLLNGSSAGADPKQFSSLVGVGSDTTQDVLNALAGFNNAINYTPLQSTLASGLRQITSWDAIIGTTPSCITPKAPGTTFLRPNGSSNGRRALSRAIDGGTWPAATADCGGVKAVGGLIDFARSSAGPPATGTPLTYIPMGRDALSFAYFANGVAPVTTLTSAQLSSLFSTGPQIIGGIEIVPCGIQTGSGTYQSWNTSLGITQTTETTGTAICNPTAADRLQENDANGLATKGASFPGKQVIVGFSAANIISQSNGRAVSALNPNVDLGSIDALGKPYTGTAPNLAPSASFYASQYGRDVYNVVSTVRISNPGSNDLKTMFVGNTSSVCQASATIALFGFASIGAACGSTTLTGAYLAN